jgi:hypothetical protein
MDWRPMAHWRVQGPEGSLVAPVVLRGEEEVWIRL